MPCCICPRFDGFTDEDSTHQFYAEQQAVEQERVKAVKVLRMWEVSLLAAISAGSMFRWPDGSQTVSKDRGH